MKRWNEADTLFLKENYKSMSDSELGLVLNRDASSILCRRKHLRLMRRGVLLLFEKSPDLEKEWIFDRNKLDPYSISYGSHSEAWWKCGKNPEHVWKSIIKNRALRNDGCPYCCNNAINHTNSLLTLEPEISSEWDYNKNDITPDKLSRGSKRKVWWICKNNAEHKWQCTISCRTERGVNCPYCIKPGNSFAEKYPNIINEWHPSLNGDLKPQNINFGSHKRVWWQCQKKIEHVWSTAAKSRATSNCPFCCSSKGEMRICEWLNKNYIPYSQEYKFPDCRHVLPLRFDFCIHENPIKLIEYQGQQHYEKIGWMEDNKLEDTVKRDKIKLEYCKKNSLNLLVIPYWDFNRIEDILSEFLLKSLFLN